MNAARACSNCLTLSTHSHTGRSSSLAFGSLAVMARRSSDTSRLDSAVSSPATCVFVCVHVCANVSVYTINMTPIQVR